MVDEQKYFFQRMDGAMLPSLVASESEVIEVAKDFGLKMTKPFCPGINTDGRINYFGYVWKDVHTQAERIIKAIKKDPNFLPRVVKMWEKRAAALKNFEKKIAGMNLKEIPDSRLYAVFEKLVELYQAEYSPALLCDPFGLHTEKIIVEKIKAITEKRNEPRKIAEYLEILTAQSVKSFANEEELSLLLLAKEIKKFKKFLAVIKKDVRKADKEIKKYPKIEKTLDKHRERYFWIENSYVHGVKLDRIYFLKKIRNYFKENITIEKKINSLTNLPKNFKKRKKILITKLNLEKELRDLLKWTETFAYLHDGRKAVMMEVYYYFALILKEMGKRMGLGLKEMYYIDHHKLKELFLEKKKIDKKLIKQRMKLCVYLIWPKKYKIVVGKEAKKWAKEFLEEKKETVRELKGVSASSGIFVGKAKIVRDVKDGWKIKKGDVLVTGMTRPHWMAFIKKAGAIVTEEGGITCHAAIVARELGIPCIIAAKVATKIFKDDDLIEVNTNHNRVKILKRK